MYLNQERSCGGVLVKQGLLLIEMMSLLNAEHVTRRFSPTSGIENFSLQVEKTDVVLVLGPNGAGKTTAFRSILGLLPVTSGTVTILGEDIANREKALMGVGAMISRPTFYDYLTGFENLELWAIAYPSVDSKRIVAVMELVGLTQDQHKKVGVYSSGMKQRLDLARAILHQPQLLILDEPFNGMDIEFKFELKQVLKSLIESQQIGIVISSHMALDLEEMATRLVIVYQGHTLFEGPMSVVQGSQMSLEVFYLDKLNAFKAKEGQDDGVSHRMDQAI